MDKNDKENLKYAVESVKLHITSDFIVVVAKRRRYVTLDWNRYWTTTDESEEARKFAVKMADMISDFIRDKISINSVADYGCGPATLLFVLAKRFPHKEFYGFDIAGSVIKENTERALQLNLQNLHFEQDSLPNPCKKRKFDLVMCFATLHYVKEIKVAIRNLFELVNPNGYLIFNYPNVFTRAAYRRDIKPNNDHMKRRFALVLAGKNLLSFEKIREIIGVRPRKFYSSTKANIYVLIHKA